MKDSEQESNYLGRKIERALDYFGKVKYKEGLSSQLYQKNEELVLVEKEILFNERDMERKEAIFQEIKDGIRDISSQISNILEDSNYKEVKQAKALYRDVNKDNILKKGIY